ncbi:hypothetical protein GCM10009612_17460 [Streptomyces beijiangensis]
MRGELRRDLGECVGEGLLGEAGGGAGEVDGGVDGAEEAGDAPVGAALGEGRPGTGPCRLCA